MKFKRKEVKSRSSSRPRVNVENDFKKTKKIM